MLKMRSSVEKTPDDSSVVTYISSEKIWRGVVRRFLRNKTALISLIIFLVICLACALAPFLTPWGYGTINSANIRATPSIMHILGTDGLGRDIFTRLLFGGRVTLRVALLSTALALIIGGVLGLFAGYFGGHIDLVIFPILDILASIPIILLVVVVEAVFGFGNGYFMYAMIIAAIPQFARIARASAMNIAGCDYIEAARALGVGHITTLFRHVLHNITSPLIVRFARGVAEAILICTILGYLGIGTRPPMPEWGGIIHGAYSSIRTHPHIMIVSCAVVTICIVSVHLFSEGLREALNPREKRARSRRSAVRKKAGIRA